MQDPNIPNMPVAPGHEPEALAEEAGRSPQMPPVVYSWSHIEAAVRRLSELLKEGKEDIKQIVAVGRGGMIPAVMLAHLLDVRDVDYIRAQSYSTEGEQGDLEVDVCPWEWNTVNTLFIDELWDTGATMKEIRDQNDVAKLAVLFTKESSPEYLGVLDYCAQEAPSTWLVMPWEQR